MRANECTVDTNKRSQVGEAVTHSFHEPNPGCWDSLVTTSFIKEGKTVQFRFLLNCGSTFTLESQTAVTLNSLLLNKASGGLAQLDGILLTGSRIEEVGGLPSPISSNGTFGTTDFNVPVYCTEPTFKLAKLSLYDRVATLDSRTRLFIGDENTPIPSTISSNVGLDAIDLALSCTKRIRYSEIVKLTKPWESDSDLHDDDDDLAVLTLQAFPTGVNLGSSVWFLTGPGAKSSVMIGTSFTTRANWFFDGLDPHAIPNCPEVLVTACPLGPSNHIQEGRVSNGRYLTERSLSQLRARIPNLPSTSSTSAAHRILSATKRTLQNGGSVLLPIDLGLDALKLLILFESAWTSSLRVYQIFFVSPTGALLLEFVKTMLDWTSALFRDRFCATRRNPFDNFDFVQFTSSLTARELSSGVPKLIIVTPARLMGGDGASLDAFTKICEDPKSLVIFTSAPSDDDLRLTKNGNSFSVQRRRAKCLPADELYELYLEERTSTSSKYDGYSSVPDTELPPTARESAGSTVGVSTLIDDGSKDVVTRVMVSNLKQKQEIEEDSKSQLGNGDTTATDGLVDKLMLTGGGHEGGDIIEQKDDDDDDDDDDEYCDFSKDLIKFFSPDPIESGTAEAIEGLSALPQDDYGTLLAITGDWADLQQSYCQHGGEDGSHQHQDSTSEIKEQHVLAADSVGLMTEKDVWDTGVSVKQLQRLRRSGFCGAPLTTMTTVAGGEWKEDIGSGTEDTDDLASMRKHRTDEIPEWRKELRSWHGGQDPVSEIVETTLIKVSSSRSIITGLFEDSTSSRPFDAESFSDWLCSSIVAIRPKTVIMLPSAMNPDILHSLLQVSLQRVLTDCPKFKFCRLLGSSHDPIHWPQELQCPLSAMLHSSRSSKTPFCISEHDVLMIAHTHILWNELLVDLEPSSFATFLRLTPDRNLGSQFFSVPPSKSTVTRSRAGGVPNKSLNPNISVAYLQLDLSHIPVTCTGGTDVESMSHSRKTIATTGTISKLRMLKAYTPITSLSSNGHKTNNILEDSSSHLMSSSETLSTDDDDDDNMSSDTIGASVSYRQDKSRRPPVNTHWVTLGQMRQQQLLSWLGNRFPTRTIRASPNLITVKDRVAIRVDNSASSQTQILHLHGGFDLTTQLLRKQLHSVLKETGSVFTRSLFGT